MTINSRLEYSSYTHGHYFSYPPVSSRIGRQIPTTDTNIHPNTTQATGKRRSVTAAATTTTTNIVATPTTPTPRIQAKHAPYERSLLGRNEQSPTDPNQPEQHQQHHEPAILRQQPAPRDPLALARRLTLRLLRLEYRCRF